MNSILTIAILCVTLFVKVSWQLDVIEEPESFCYTKPACGPDSSAWSPLCHTGTRQSPINLTNTLTDILLARNTRLSLSHRYRGNSFRIRNNGLTIIVTFSPEDTAASYLEGSEFAQRYQFEAFHFHWGPNSTVGSEHLINSKRSSMELHLVHYNSKFNSLVEAASSNEADALAVIGFQLEAKASNPNNQALTPILRNIPREYQNEYREVNEAFNIYPLFPTFGSYYFSYNGSLTTPGCNQVVRWIFMKEPIQISLADAESFRGISDQHAEELTENFRPVQASNQRKVVLNRIGVLSWLWSFLG